MLSDKKLERFALAACACCCTIGITAGIGYGIAFHTFGDVVVDAVVAAAVTSILFVAALCIKKGWYKSTPKNSTKHEILVIK